MKVLRRFSFIVILITVCLPTLIYAQTDIQFNEKGRYPIGEGPHGIASGDLNNDSNQDLVITGQNGDITVILGDGTGGFGIPLIFDGGHFERGVPVLADYNNDGHLDAVVNQQDDLSCMLGDGTGTLTTFWTGPREDVYFTFIVGGDFNSDENSDVAALGFGGGCLIPYFGYGDGTFHSYQAPTFMIAYGMVAGDFNGDEKTDLLVTTKFLYEFVVASLWGLGNGVFNGIGGAWTNWPIVFDKAISNIYSGDFNNDGIDDFAVIVENQSVSIYFGSIDGDFSWNQDLYGNSIAIGNFNLDSFPDIVAANTSTEEIFIYLNNGNGWFTEEFTMTYTEGDIYNNGIIVDDFNGDSLSDIAVGLLFDGDDTVSILLNGPPSVFDMISDLIDEILGDETIEGGTENSLVSKLENALNKLEQDNENASSNILEALINQIEALKGKKIDPILADNLIANIQNIIDINSGLAKRVALQDISEIPETFSLSQNSPNPFNPATTISYGLPDGTSGYVTLKVYDLRGALVRTLVDQAASPGMYSVVWDGTDKSGNRVSSGIYIYQLQAGEFTKSNKMMLMR